MRHRALSPCFWSGPGFAEGIMASGPCTAPTGRRHGRTDQRSQKLSDQPCRRGAVQTWRIRDAAGVTVTGDCCEIFEHPAALMSFAATRGQLDAVWTLMGVHDADLRRTLC